MEEVDRMETITLILKALAAKAKRRNP